MNKQSQTELIMRILKKIWEEVRPRGGWRYPAIIIVGAFVGLFIYSFFTSRAYSYLSEDPKTCVNCHLMSPYYATWSHSSHGRNTTCVDCHLPHDNIFHKYFVKAENGLRHAAVFTMKGEKTALQAIPASSEVVMNNCIRCHTQLNQEFVKTGHMGFKETKENRGNACWDCHRDVPHTRSRSEVATPNSLVPMPDTKVPSWLSDAMKEKNLNN